MKSREKIFGLSGIVRIVIEIDILFLLAIGSLHVPASMEWLLSIKYDLLSVSDD